MNTQDVQTRADALLRPISDAAPTGENVAYDPRFEALRSEVGKLDSPAGGDVDWDSVAKQGQELLTSTSKDLLLASYTSYALLQTERLGGLAIGLGILRGMLERYWEDCYPPVARLRGRANALDWLVARLEVALPTLDVGPADRAALDLVIDGFRKLSDIARAKLQDATPGLGGVSETLQRMDMKIPKASPVASGGNEPPPPDPPPPAPPMNGSHEPTPEQAPPPSVSAPAPAPAPEQAPSSSVSAPAPAPADDPVAKLQAQAAEWLQPIAPDKPIGEDARYDPAYEATRVEIAKLESTTLEVVNWEAVAKSSEQILKQRSKDVLIASYLAYAKFQLHGVAGLSLGLAIVGGMFDTFAEDRFPSRLRGQGNAVGWLTALLELRLGELKPTPNDRPAIATLQKVAKAFAASVRDRLEDHAPSLRPIEERIQRLLLAIPEPKPEPKPAPQPAAPAPAPTSAPSPAAAPRLGEAMPTATADVSSAEEVGKYLQETGRALVKVAGILRRAQPSSAAAYRLLRMGLYLHLDQAPPAGPGGKTQIPGLPEPRRKQFELIAANAKWDALIEETESALTQFRFSLDLQRMTATALENLGPDYEAAHRTLIAEVASVLARMPQLVDLAAADGSPLASPDTKSWIASKVLAGSGGGNGAGAPAGASDDPGEALEKAKALLAGQKGSEALALAKSAIEEAGHPRLRFVRQLALAEACLNADQTQLARAMFASLEEQLRERGLLQWEPALASRCLEGLVRSIRAAIKKGAKIDGADTAFERLAAIDPVAAAKLATA